MVVRPCWCWQKDCALTRVMPGQELCSNLDKGCQASVASGLLLLRQSIVASKDQQCLLTLKEPVPDKACTVAMRPSLITEQSAPKASFALSWLNFGKPVIPKYSCAGMLRVVVLQSFHAHQTPAAVLPGLHKHS